MKFAKLLRMPFLKNICERLPLPSVLLGFKQYPHFFSYLKSVLFASLAAFAIFQVVTNISTPVEKLYNIQAEFRVPIIIVESVKKQKRIQNPVKHLR